MPELDISVIGVEPAEHAASPTLYFKLAISQKLAEDEKPVRIQNVALQTQVRIDAKKRIYKPEEQERLTDLFGAPERWSQTLRNMLWTLANVNVPAFDGTCEIDLPVICSFDFNLAAPKYFAGLEFGKVPLQFMFSGSIFFRNDEGALEMELISWEKEDKFRLPIEVWQEMMETYYPNRNWLCINRQVFNALYEYKRRHGYPGFEEALTSLLPDVNKAAS